jgi:ATPase subunit of ABC transporter with duplicated ATPase domains
LCTKTLLARTSKKKKTQQNWLARTGKYGKQKKTSQNRLARTGKYEKQKKPAKIGWHVHANMESVHIY